MTINLPANLTCIRPKKELLKLDSKNNIGPSIRMRGTHSPIFEHGIGLCRLKSVVCSAASIHSSDERIHLSSLKSMPGMEVIVFGNLYTTKGHVYP